MNTNETIEINDLALTEDQQAEVKGGTTLQDCLVASYQSGGSESGLTHGAANLVSFDTPTPGHPTSPTTTINHNETVESDEALTQLTDLEPVDEVQGGTTPGSASLVRFNTSTPGTTSGAASPGTLTPINGNLQITNLTSVA